jgi:ankyrin repeat protein
MDLPPPPQANDPIITQFKPVQGQWELNDKNIQHIGTKTGETILHNYCRYVNTTPLEVYRYLIEVKGCDVNAQDKDKDTAVHRAITYFRQNGSNNNTVLTYLLSQNGVNANVKNQFGSNLLHFACRNINNLSFDIFKLLIETMGGDLNVQNNSNDTPIHCAIHYFEQNHQNVSILTYLLNHKDVNVNQPFDYGCTLFHIACLSIHTLPLDIFKHIVEIKGGDINIRDEFDCTPIDLSFQRFRQDDGSNIDVLMYLLSLDDVNVNAMNKIGHTLLHLVCQNISNFPIDVFKYMIEFKGGDINLKDMKNDTPIHNALRFFNPKTDFTILFYLLNQSDININDVNQFGLNLLHLACIQNLPGLDDEDEDYDDEDYDEDYDDDDDEDDDEDDTDSPHQRVIGDEEVAETAGIDTIRSQIVEILIEKYLKLDFD